MSVFYGWLPDADAQAALGTLVDGLRADTPADAPPHAWRNPQQWHLTLRFLEDAVDPERRAELSAALTTATASLEPFEAAIAALQYWPGARVLVATLAPSPAMDALMLAAEQAARACGYPAEKRAPRPHLTLAYLRQRVPGTALPRLPAPPAVPLRIASACLLRTIPLGYRNWHEAPLGASHGG